MRDLLIRLVYFLPALVLRACGWRLLRLTNPHRIGHLAAEPDCILKDRVLGVVAKQKPLLLAPAGHVANEHLIQYWSALMPTVRSPLLCRALAPVNRFAFARACPDLSRYVAAIGETAEGMRVQRQWGSRQHLLAIGKEDAKRGQEALTALGVPQGARIVCFHSREGGYSPGDEHLHDYRNSEVENYLGAAAALVERGFYCIRMGDPSMKRLVVRQGVIDYAHSPLRADWLDVFLCARCYFFLGNSSGLSFVAGIFGRPSALANLLPFSAAFPFGPQDIGIPKLLRRGGRLLPFAEILCSDLADLRFSELYAKRDVEPVESAGDEIRDLALEMLDRLAGAVRYTEADEALQRRFRALLKPGHFSYGSAARIGRDFLRKYAHLIGEPKS